MTCRRTKAVGIAAAAAAMVFGMAGSSWADGSATISGAPVAAWGTQQFGNLADADLWSGEGCDGSSPQFWLLGVTAGDVVTVDWESNAADVGYYHLDVYPIGTTDFNVGQTNATAAFQPNSNGKAESTWTVSKSGTMPIGFIDYGGCGDVSPGAGPYDFTAYVRHAAVVALGRLSRTASSATATVKVHTPDGEPITSGLTVKIQVAVNGSSKWVTAGSASVTSTSAKVRYKVPSSFRRKTIQMRARVSGGAYLTETSAAQTFRLG